MSTTPRFVWLIGMCVLGWAQASGQGDAMQAELTMRRVKVFAAGSLAAPLNQVATTVRRESNITLELTFGPSGTLRERIERGEVVDLFASANMDHPRALTAAGIGGPTSMFTRNALCAFGRAGVALSPETMLDRLLDPTLKVATSTPVADPAGDYAWLLFRKADAIRPGAYATLDAKALKLAGGAVVTPTPPAVPAGRNATAFYLEAGTADVFLYYCWGQGAVLRDAPSTTATALPPTLAVRADYGLTVMKNAAPDASQVAAFILSPQGQQIFKDAGFDPASPVESQRFR